MKFLIMPNKDKDKDLHITKDIMCTLESLNQKSFLLHEDAKRLNENCGIEQADIKEMDVVVVLGGDGTILNTARKIATSHVPLLGVNLGRLGFLAEVEKDHIKEAFTKIIQGEYTLEKRMMLKINYEPQEGPQVSYKALNDVVMTRGSFSRMVDLSIYINDQYIDTFTADGVIISTPTGSTAYNLSAGGPIISPSSDMMVITPICPHSLYVRSIIVAAEDTIKVVNDTKDTEREGQVMLTIDGQTGFSIGYKDAMFISKWEHHIEMVKTTDNNFYDILREKMFK